MTARRSRSTTAWWRRPYVWALVSATAVVVANASGIAIGDDGVGYQATADHLLAGKGLGYFLEPKLTIWPPGWPLLMAFVARATPLDTAQAAVALNAVTAFAMVLLLNRLLRRLVRDEELILLGTIVVAIGASSMVFGHLLMTDFAFAAITIALLLALINFRRSDGLGWLVLSIALVWGGFMIRYAGIVHIATGAVWFLVDRRYTLWARARWTAFWIGAASIVPGLWILRNLSTDKTALGVRYSSARGLLGNALDMVATIGNFLMPGVQIEMRTVWAAVSLAGCAVVAWFLWRIVRTRPHLRSGRGWIDFAGGALGLVTLHIGIYLAYMLYARTTTGLNRLDFRLLNPVYLPLVVVGLAAVDRIVALDPDPDRRMLQLGARGAARAWAVVNIGLGLVMIGWFASGPDLFVGNYERAAFETARRSPALDEIPRDCNLSSNLPNALYGAGVEAQWSPRLTGLESDDRVDDLAVTEKNLRTERECLIWVDLEPTYGHLATRAELRKRFRLEELARAGAVTVYELHDR